jgi:metal-responsive CopG/Arc/MetJ family transcriptional regulator
MSESVSISIPKKLLSQINKEMKKKGMSRSELIADVMEKYFYLQEFYRLRKKAVPLAQAQGILTDEDVFDRVS